jgi:hypothetical protein
MRQWGGSTPTPSISYIPAKAYIAKIYSDWFKKCGVLFYDIALGGMRKTTKFFSHGNEPPSRDTNPGPYEYEVLLPSRCVPLESGGT